MESDKISRNVFPPTFTLFLTLLFPLVVVFREVRCAAVDAFFMMILSQALIIFRACIRKYGHLHTSTDTIITALVFCFCFRRYCYLPSQYPLGLDFGADQNARDLDYYATVTDFAGMFTGDSSYVAHQSSFFRTFFCWSYYRQNCSQMSYHVAHFPFDVSILFPASVA